VISCWARWVKGCRPSMAISLCGIGNERGSLSGHIRATQRGIFGSQEVHAI
jgi:hypothetical protein